MSRVEKGRKRGGGECCYNLISMHFLIRQPWPWNETGYEESKKKKKEEENNSCSGHMHHQGVWLHGWELDFLFPSFSLFISLFLFFSDLSPSPTSLLFLHCILRRHWRFVVVAAAAKILSPLFFLLYPCKKAKFAEPYEDGLKRWRWENMEVKEGENRLLHAHLPTGSKGDVIIGYTL